MKDRPLSADVPLPPREGVGPSGQATFNREDAEDAGCSGGESFALRVLGDSMAPEFNDGEIIIVEPDGALRAGCYVLAQWQGEWTFRQLTQDPGGWCLHALNPAFADQRLPDLSAIHGVIIQKSVPGRRRMTKHYI